MLRTEFTEMFGTRHPLVCGGMTGVGTADLIGPVAQAGALGFLTALAQPSPGALANEIAWRRQLTDQPFGVNLTLLPTLKPVPCEDYVAVVIDSGIGVGETVGRSLVAALRSVPLPSTRGPGSSPPRRRQSMAT